MSDDVWTFYERVADEPRDRLTPTERAVAAVSDLRQEVNSGGFESYFSYSYGDEAPHALAALPALLGREWAELLAEAMRLLGPTYPLEQDDRFTIVDDPAVGDALSALDERFYELEAGTDADGRLSAALRGASG